MILPKVYWNPAFLVLLKLLRACVNASASFHWAYFFSMQELTNNIFDGLEYIEGKMTGTMASAKKLWDAQAAAIEKRRRENNARYALKAKNRNRLKKIRP